MSRSLTILRSSAGMTLQDAGRAGWLDVGLSCGGAADRLALSEGAALLGQSDRLAAIEMAGTGGEFQTSSDVRIALTGAPMQATLDQRPLVWNASHLLPAGSRLSIGGTRCGNYGYLHVGGGVSADMLLGARSAHISAGIGGSLPDGSQLPIGSDVCPDVGQVLDVADRFNGGKIRVVETAQTAMFTTQQRERFIATEFQRDIRGNRMGVKLNHSTEGFQAEQARTVLSEVVVPGDIQITGDGTPFVLLAECQTTGGYPRIATVIPSDLAKVAQASAGASLRFEFVAVEDAVEIERSAAQERAGLSRRLRPLIRDPHTIADLLSYQLIGGVTAGDED